MAQLKAIAQESFLLVFGTLQYSFENYDIGIGYHKFKNIIILVSNV